MENVSYRKSFQAKLILNRQAIAYYQSIKDLCAAHKGVKTRQSFSKETINFGKERLAQLKIGRKNLILDLNLDSSDMNLDNYNLSLTKGKNATYFSYSLTIKNDNSLNQGMELLEIVFEKNGAKELCAAPLIDFSKLYYERDFDTLLAEGLIKKYVKKNKDNDEHRKVTFRAKLLFNAQNQAEELFIISNHGKWDFAKAIMMNKLADGSYFAEAYFPINTNLEFKICRSKSFNDVEKGIWQEEIANHYYTIIEDLEIEDLIYNFRKL